MSAIAETDEVYVVVGADGTRLAYPFDKAWVLKEPKERREYDVVVKGNQDIKIDVEMLTPRDVLEYSILRLYPDGIVPCDKWEIGCTIGGSWGDHYIIDGYLIVPSIFVQRVRK